jgi:DNA-binding transcriptional ArsR family regulator
MKIPSPSAPPIKSPRQIRALASAVRQDIVDALESAGPCTIRELAGLLGRRPDALYYHLRVLSEVGLIAQFASARNGENGATVDVLSRPLHLNYNLSDRSNREGICRVVDAMSRSAQRNFRRAFRPGDAKVNGPTRDLWAGRCQGWLSEEDMREVNRLLSRILSIVRARHTPTRRAAKRREITFILAPLPTRPSMKLL